MAKLTIRAASGRSPAKAERDLFKAIAPTQGDLLAVAVIHEGLILGRTTNGLDADGIPFAPYSTQGPIYIKIGTSGTSAGRASAIQRLARGSDFKPRQKVRKELKKRKDPIERAASRAKRSAESTPRERVSKGGGTEVGQITPGGYLKAESYSWFKHSFLGRADVDLLGPRAPHMLQALMVRFGGRVRRSRSVPALGALPSQKPRDVEMGLFGPEAARGHGLHFGAGHLPPRPWLAFGAGDGPKLLKVARDRIARRIQGRR